MLIAEKVNDVDMKNRLQFDDTGYMSGRPLRPDQWQAVADGAPEGIVISRNAAPPGFFIVNNFLDASVCDAIVNECEALPGQQHTVAALDDQAANAVQSSARVSEMIDVRSITQDVNGLVQNTYANVVGPHFRSTIEWFEQPEILRYKPGGQYKPHADADNWFPETKNWKRVIDRDLSILIYLNEGFSGGEIVFPNFGVTLQPTRGLLIAFPSDCRYLHTARPVTAQTRYALVSWAAIKGGPRVQAAPQRPVIRM